MRSIPSNILALCQESKIHTSAAIFVNAPVLTNIWGGAGELVLQVPNANTIYKGIQADTLSPAATFEIGNASNGITMKISGADPQLVPLMLEADLRGRDCIIHRLYFTKSDAELLHIEPFFFGAVDRVLLKDNPGGSSDVEVMIEGETQSLSRVGGRIASDQDQRLIDPNDSGMSFISHAGEKTLYWGALPPARSGKVINGGVIATGSRGGYSQNYYQTQ